MTSPIAPSQPGGYPGTAETSGTVTYDPPATDIITRAYRIIGAINEDEKPTSGMYEDAIDSLQALMKHLQATGIHIWTVEEAILFLQQYQERYLLYQGGPDMSCDAYSWGLSSIGLNAPAGATSITLSGLNGYFPPINPAPGMNIGITLDSGQAFWTTISGPVTGLPTAYVVPLTAPLPSSSSSAAFCYFFDPASAIVRPLRVPFARRINFAVGLSGASLGPTETPLTNMMSRREYMDLPNKQSPGQVTQAYYNPALFQGEMYVWNPPQNANSGLRFTWYRPIQDIGNVNNLPDLPQEWDLTLKWNLAVELGPQYDVPAERWDRIQARAASYLETVMGFDREPESIYFGRSYDTTRR